MTIREAIQNLEINANRKRAIGNTAEAGTAQQTANWLRELVVLRAKVEHGCTDARCSQCDRDALDL